jgi:uncharacterized protein
MTILWKMRMIHIKFRIALYMIVLVWMIVFISKKHHVHHYFMMPTTPTATIGPWSHQNHPRIIQYDFSGIHYYPSSPLIDTTILVQAFVYQPHSTHRCCHERHRRNHESYSSSERLSIVSSSLFNIAKDKSYLQHTKHSHCHSLPVTSVRHHRMVPSDPGHNIRHHTSPLPTTTTSRTRMQGRRNNHHLLHSLTLFATSSNNESNEKDLYYNPRSTALLIVGQSSVILIGIVLGWLFRIPQYGFMSSDVLPVNTLVQNIQYGFVSTIPLGIFAIVLDQLESYLPALKEVGQVTQRTILSLMGNQYKPRTAFVISIVLGMIAGLGEELLFRGVIQNVLNHQLSSYVASSSFLSSIASSFHIVFPMFGSATPIVLDLSMIISIVLSSIIFGLLHYATTAYAILAMIASFYFGFLYVLSYSNLWIPIICHSIYDIIALYAAHYIVTKQLTRTEQMNLMTKSDE